MSFAGLWPPGHTILRRADGLLSKAPNAGQLEAWRAGQLDTHRVDKHVGGYASTCLPGDFPRHRPQSAPDRSAQGPANPLQNASQNAFYALQNPFCCIIMTTRERETLRAMTCT